MRRKSRWVLPKALSTSEQKRFTQLSMEISSEYPTLSSIGMQVLWRRGIQTSEQARELLVPDVGRLTQATKQLPGLDQAAKKIAEAMKQNKQILIYGDYDVDGVCATAILWRFLYWELGYTHVKPIIPNRYSEGYGVNADRLTTELKSATKGADVLLITVDCGIKDAELLAEIAQNHGKLDVIITDHHLPPEFAEQQVLKSSDAVKPGQLLVHPRLGGKFPWPEICAAGISWMLVSVLRELLGGKAAAQITLDPMIPGQPHQVGTTPNLEALELASLATVCDQMPLLGINRDIVRLGLSQLAQTKNVGLKALAGTAGIELDQAGVYEFGYVIGPRINAAGRMQDATLALQLLCTRSPQKALKLAGELELLNQERQQHTQAALQQLKTIPASVKAAILTNPIWKEGIVGLIAGKLQESTGLPSLVATQNHEGNWVGSARSNGNINITELIASQSKLLIKFGGHAAAAGFTVADENLEAFKEGILAQAGQFEDSVLTSIRGLDAVIAPDMVNLNQIESLRLLEPFGQGFAAPKLLLPNITVSSYREFGQQARHLATQQTYPSGSFELIWFNHELDLKKVTRKQHSFIGYLGYNEWRGQITPQFNITDVFIDAEN